HDGGDVVFLVLGGGVENAGQHQGGRTDAHEQFQIARHSNSSLDRFRFNKSGVCAWSFPVRQPSILPFADGKPYSMPEFSNCNLCSADAFISPSSLLRAAW